MTHSVDFIEKLNRDAFSKYQVPENYVLDTHGWCDEQNFLSTLDKALTHVKSPLVIEVGTWKGKSACAMASHLKNSGMILCIDTWLGAPEFWTWGLDDATRGLSLNKHNGYPRVYETFLANVKSLGHESMIAPFPLSSIQAAEVLKYHAVRADVIYIDAAHEETAVRADLDAFFPLLISGGTLMGDDYVAWPGVKRAVDAFVKDHGLGVDVSGEVWSVTKK